MSGAVVGYYRRKKTAAVELARRKSQIFLRAGYAKNLTGRGYTVYHSDVKRKVRRARGVARDFAKRKLRR